MTGRRVSALASTPGVAGNDDAGAGASTAAVAAPASPAAIFRLADTSAWARRTKIRSSVWQSRRTPCGERDAGTARASLATASNRWRVAEAAAAAAVMARSEPATKTIRRPFVAVGAIGAPLMQELDERCRSRRSTTSAPHDCFEQSRRVEARPERRSTRPLSPVIEMPVRARVRTTLTVLARRCIKGDAKGGIAKASASGALKRSQTRELRWE